MRLQQVQCCVYIFSLVGPLMVIGGVALLVRARQRSSYGWAPRARLRRWGVPRAQGVAIRDPAAQVVKGYNRNVQCAPKPTASRATQ